MFQNRVTTDKLVSELQAHVAVLAAEAAAGDVEAKQWLLWAFPGNTQHFREVSGHAHRAPAKRAAWATTRSQSAKRKRFSVSTVLSVARIPHGNAEPSW